MAKDYVLSLQFFNLYFFVAALVDEVRVYFIPQTLFHPPKPKINKKNGGFIKIGLVTWCDWKGW